MIKIQKMRKDYIDARKEFLKDKVDGRLADVESEFNKRIQPKVDLYLGEVKNLLNNEYKLTNELTKELNNQFKKSKNSLVIISVIAIFFGISLSSTIALNITSQIKEAVKLADNVADGNLNNEINVSSEDEIGKLVKSLKTMNDNLSNIVKDVRVGAMTVHEASEEISSGNFNLSKRTEDVASSLEEASCALEEFTQGLVQTAEQATKAKDMSREAYVMAEVAGREMENVIKIMVEINSSSEKVVEIISLMDSISFQTNLLALNAAVEAAHAGEQGRGFAVVATEVRELSGRSANAAKDIKKLIEESRSKVNAGSLMVNKAGSTIDNLIANIQNVHAINNEINSSTKEQSLGIKQINEVIAQLDESTQNNASLVEESSVSASALEEQANHLSMLVGKFKTL